MCSEYIIEEGNWEGTSSFSESAVHKNILPKYYDELSILEKDSIIKRNFKTYTQIGQYSTPESSGPNQFPEHEPPVQLPQDISSYFYCPDLAELNTVARDGTISLYGGDYKDSLLGEYPPLLSRAPSPDINMDTSRKKTYKDGTLGDYFTTNILVEGDPKNTNITTEFYVGPINNEGIAAVGFFGEMNGENGPELSGGISCGVLPFCDIKGDTIIEKDPDGYWRIIEAPEDIPVEPPKIFGIQRDITNPSPEWTRTGDAVGMTATASVGNTAGHSDFDKYMPWAGMVRETLSTGDVMVKIPKFYYRRYREGNIEHIEIADKPVEGFSVHPSFNHTGQEKDFIYIGAYKISSNNKSISGATPQVNQLRSVMRNNAHSKGEGWSIIDISTLSAIQMLFLVEYATNDSQKAIGRGYVDGNSSILQTGTCDNVLNLTGVPTGTNGKVDAIYRGIEGLWGNIREWIDGINFNNSEIWVCNNPSQYADGTPTNYTKLSYNLINNTGYIIELGIDQGENKHIMLPFKAGGTNSTYYPDYVNGNINNRTWRVLNIGGGLQGNSDAGLFCSYGDFGPMNSHDRVGSRLLYIPSSIGHSGDISQ